MHFAVIATPRTGSSHLMSLLSGHPEIFTNGNIFDDRDHLYLFWPEKKISVEKEKLTSLRESDPNAFLKLVLQEGFGKPHVGFKIFNNENNEMLEKVISDSSIRKIVLLRSNILASYSSRIVARQTGKYGILEEKNIAVSALGTFNRVKFIEYHNDHLQFYGKVFNSLIDNNQEYYVYHYEDINEPLILASLIKFIGADPRKALVKSQQYKRQVKQNPPDILARFSNVNKAKRFLQKEDLQHWMHEGETSLKDLNVNQNAEISSVDK